MSFPPNLGITNSFIIDSSCLIFQEFPSLLPQLDHITITSPFNKHRMNGYSRIKKSTPNRSKSLDFSELSLTRSTPYNSSKLIKSHQATPDLCKITTLHDSIPEHDVDGVGEVFGDILGRRKCVGGGGSDETAAAEQERSFSVKRSASVSDGYSRIHHQSAEDELIESRRCGKKKGKLFRAFKRWFGL